MQGGSTQEIFQSPWFFFLNSHVYSEVEWVDTSQCDLKGIVYRAEHN